MNTLSGRNDARCADASTRAGLGRAGLMVLAAAGALALAGCEQHPYPTPAPDEQSPPPAPPSRLMGAPEGPNGAPPPADVPPADAATHAAAAGGEIGGAAGARPPCPPDPTYRGPNAPAVIICNAPIPNPPEDQPAHHYGRHHGWRHHHRWTPASAGEAAPAPYGRWSHHHRRHHHVFAAPAATAPGVATAPVGPAPHHRHPRHPLAATTAPLAAAAATPRPHHGAVPHPPHPRSASHAAAAQVPATARNGRALKLAPVPTAAAPAPTTTASEAGRFTALQAALAGEVGHQAALSAPSHFTAGQTSEVALTLPAAFAQAVQTDAAAQQLDAATTASNLTATLAGDGFAVTPEEAQSQPVTIGQPIVFRWKVTPQANARGPLQADMALDMPSQGRSLPLGSIKSLAGVSRISGRAIGVGLLVLVAALAIAWGARGRRRPLPVGASRPRENHLTGI